MRMRAKARKNNSSNHTRVIAPNEKNELKEPERMLRKEGGKMDDQKNNNNKEMNMFCEIICKKYFVTCLFFKSKHHLQSK